MHQKRTKYTLGKSFVKGTQKLTNVYNFSLGGETDDWGVSKDDDWADDSSIFEELLPPCDTVEAPDTPCSNATVTPPEIRYRDPVLSRLIAQVKAKLFDLGNK